MSAMPSISQQRGFAYAPKPFAVLSFLASAYVVYDLLVRKSRGQNRMFHRLILAMNINIVPQSLGLFWGTWAMPEGTPYSVGAVGSARTCSVQGFTLATFLLTVPYYYASLSLYSLVAVKNNFQEDKYQWIEKWIHIGAYCIPLALAIYSATKNEINPLWSYCFIDVYPIDCGQINDPPCERAPSRNLVMWGFVWAQICVDILVTSSSMLYLWCSFEKIQREVDRSIGMKQIVEKARKKRLRDVAFQTMFYLLGFWTTYLSGFITTLVNETTGKPMYGAIIFSNCMYACQGLIFMLIYFNLQRKPGRCDASEILSKGNSLLSSESLNQHQTVSGIRATVARRSIIVKKQISDIGTYSFHIFDGTPAEDSPWAQFFNEDEETARDESIMSTIQSSTKDDIDMSLIREDDLSKNLLLQEDSGQSKN